MVACSLTRLSGAFETDATLSLAMILGTQNSIRFGGFMPKLDDLDNFTCRIEPPPIVRPTEAQERASLLEDLRDELRIARSRLSLILQRTITNRVLRERERSQNNQGKR